jgi:hypothetical protein
VTSCPSRVTLGLPGETLASRSKTLGLPRPLDQATCATWHRIASKVSIKRWVTSRVTEVMSWAFQGLHHRGRARPPWVQAYQVVSGGASSSLSGAKPLIRVCPWLGSQHPSSGLLALWRSELIISPCVPVRRVWPCNNNKYALHGLISHRDHSNVNHI